MSSNKFKSNTQLQAETDLSPTEQKKVNQLVKTKKLPRKKAIQQVLDEK